MIIFLFIINMVASGVMLAHAMCVLNRMNHRSNHFYRVFYVGMGVGALAVLAGPLYGYTRPQLGEVILNVSMTGVVVIGWFAKNRRAA